MRRIQPPLLLYFDSSALSASVQDTTLLSSGSSITFDVSGITSGNLLLAVIVKDDDVATTDATGLWTKLAGFESLNAIWLDIWYKEALSGDESATSYTFDGDNEVYSGILYEISNANTTPVLLSSSSDIGDTAAPLTGAFTAAESTSLIIAGFGNDNIVTDQTLDSAITTTDVASAGVSNNNDIGMAVGRYLPGSTSIPAYTHSISGSEQWAAFVIEVKKSADGGDALLADDVESESEVSSPSIAQVQALLADDVESESEVSSPAIAQLNILLADNVESDSEVSAPTLTESHALLADNVESDSEVSSPSVGQIHAILADDVESDSEVSSPAIAQVQTLLADDVESESEVSAPTLVDIGAGEDVLLAEDVESDSEVSSPAIAQLNVLLAEDVESDSEVSSPAVAQAQVLLADNVESDSEVSSPSLVENTGDVLLAENVESDSDVSDPALAQVHAILAENAESASEVSSPAVAQIQALLADDVESASEVSSPALREVGEDALLADDVESSSEVSNPALTVGLPEFGSYDKTNIIRPEVFGLTVKPEAFGIKIAAEQFGFIVEPENNGFDATRLSTNASAVKIDGLSASNVESISAVSSPTVVLLDVALSSEDVESASEVTVPSLAQVHTLSTGNVESGSEVSSPAITQLHVISANNTESESEVSQPTLLENTWLFGSDEIIAWGNDVEISL